MARWWIQARRPRVLLCLIGPPLAAAALGLTGAASPVAARPAAGDMTHAALDSLWGAGRAAEFRSALGREIAAASAHRDTLAIISLLTLSGMRDASVGWSRAAEDSLRRGIALALAVRDTAQEMPALRWLAVALGLQGRFAESSRASARLLALASALGDRRHEGWARVGLAWSSLQLGEIGQAEAEYQAAEAALRAAGDAEGEIWARNGLAMTRSRRGDLRGALAVFLDLAERAAALGYPMAEAMAVNNVGLCQYLLGDPGQAQASFARASRRHEELGQVRQALTPALNLALCLQDLGCFEAAADTLRRCRERSLAHGYLDLAGQAILEQAALERRVKRPHAAAATARSALALGDRLAAQDRARATVVLAQALVDLDSTEAALACLDRVSAEVPATVLGGVAHDLNLLRAQVLAARGEVGAAISVLASVVAAGATSGDDRAQILGLLERGRLLAAAGRRDEALGALRQGLAVWERQRSLPVDPEWRESRADAGQALATELAALILDAGGSAALDEAYRVLQTYKARTLLERRAGPGVVIPADRVAISVDSLRKSVLHDGECLLDLYLGERRSLLFAIASDTVAVWQLGPVAELAQRERSLQRWLVDLSERAIGGERMAILQAAAAGLRRDLLGPAAAITAGRRHVILSADGLAHALPLEPWLGADVTRAPQASAEIDPFRGAAWSRTPSAVMLARIRGERPPPPIAGDAPLLVIGADRLPDGRRLAGVKREQRDLQRRFGSAVIVPAITADSAFHARYAAAAAVHVATHAEVDDQAPWRSALQIGFDAASEPWRAGEIAMTPTTVGLVVLSSCATAQGRVVAGEGLIGLASAFLAGGARVVVATLWPVDDAASAVFMDLFYGELAAGRRVGEALARARAAMRQRPRFADPFFWAGYIAIGDGDLAIAATEGVGRRGMDPYRELLATMAVIAAGAMLGRLQVRGVRLDMAAMLLVGAAFAHAGVTLSPALGIFGLLLFLYTVGTQAGPSLRSMRRRDSGMAAGGVAATWILLAAAFAVGGLLGLPAGLRWGALAGFFSSGASLALIENAWPGGEPAAGFSLAAPASTLLVMLLAQAWHTRIRERAQPELAAWNARMTGGGEEALQQAAGRLGALPVDGGLPAGGRIAVRKFFVSNPGAIHVRLETLSLPERYGATVTRIRRSGIDLHPRAGLRLRWGDRVQVSAPAERMTALQRLFGDDVKGIERYAFPRAALVIFLGGALGMLPLPLAAAHATRLGPALGVLTLSLVTSMLHRTGPMVWSQTARTSRLLAQIGLPLFLAEVGNASYGGLLQAWARYGYRLPLFALLLVTMLALLVLALGRVLRQGPLATLALLPPIALNTAAFTSLQDQHRERLPAHIYAIVYPVASMALILTFLAVSLIR